MQCLLHHCPRHHPRAAAAAPPWRRVPAPARCRSRELQLGGLCALRQYCGRPWYHLLRGALSSAARRPCAQRCIPGRYAALLPRSETSKTGAAAEAATEAAAAQGTARAAAPQSPATAGIPGAAWPLPPPGDAAKDLVSPVAASLVRGRRGPPHWSMAAGPVGASAGRRVGPLSGAPILPAFSASALLCGRIPLSTLILHSHHSVVKRLTGTRCIWEGSAQKQHQLLPCILETTASSRISSATAYRWRPLL